MTRNTRGEPLSAYSNVLYVPQLHISPKISQLQHGDNRSGEVKDLSKPSCGQFFNTNGLGQLEYIQHTED
jgi:hypothetical protein